MKNCKMCGVLLSKKNLDITKMLSKEEAEKLYSIRKEKGVCSDCSTTMLMLNLGF